MSAELIQNSKNAAPDQNAGAAFQYTTGFYFCTEVFLLSRYAEGEIPSFFLKLLLK